MNLSFADCDKAKLKQFEEDLKRILYKVVSDMSKRGLTPEEISATLEKHLNELEDDHEWTCKLERYH